MPYECKHSYSPIIRKAGLPSGAARFGAAVEEELVFALLAPLIELAPAAFPAADEPPFSDMFWIP